VRGAVPIALVGILPGVEDGDDLLVDAHGVVFYEMR
jgi:hypothetical protein